jgi:uncharacterized protein
MEHGGGKNVAGARVKLGKCPICRQPTDPELRPFCSRRCRDLDLARWLQGSYAIAGGTDDADEDGDEAAIRGTLPATREGTDEDA